MPSEQTDFAVIGGGPAGAAATLTLRRHAPQRRVVLLEAGRHDRPKPGEVLPAVAQGLLRQLGVWTSFVAEAFVESRAVVSAWSGETPDERHSMFSAQGAGGQLDRARFDRLLVQSADAAGAEVRFASPVCSAVREGYGWRLKLPDGDIVVDAVIWATGRSWKLARSFGAKLRAHSHLAAYTRFFDRAPGNCQMVIEARPEGWWYSADLPDQCRVVACLTDPDLGSEMRDPKSWYRALAATQLIAPLLSSGARETAALVKSAGTVTIDPAAGERWVAAGDSLFAADPLSSRGIIHALRSGILAAYAASDMLDGHGELARKRYAMIARQGFADYVPALAAHYAAAARWDTAFWQRRGRHFQNPAAAAAQG
ncbi:FAD-dependent monooxygenase [Mesorhizobium sp.]|uniref:NAD(P)/FAD-dependent oxidoreductase n=1 Tax=Mesorhizobium sp. TaxID=1871066 RepID=UPI000FE6C74E|nr:FAD-dependent monooxygenase [Mesorhizobium sp.]RWB20859.1 MAG: FAD-dependent oxidoreductase [Mesorhizobium sp.]RWD96745.1 MAG: FAD-dependent oxidoreductase [Mesorhizobium sp.]